MRNNLRDNSRMLIPTIVKDMKSVYSSSLRQYIYQCFVPNNGFEFRGASDFDLYDNVVPRMVAPKSIAEYPDNCDPWLVEIAGHDDHRLHAPLRKTGLHRKFAKLHTQDDVTQAILKFANKYGRIGFPVRLWPLQSSLNHVTTGESALRWIEESKTMNQWLTIWDRVCREPMRDLHEYVTYTKSGNPILVRNLSYNSNRKEWQLFRTDSRFAGRTKRPTQKQLERAIQLTKAEVCHNLNQHLKGHVSPQLHIHDNESYTFFYPDTLLSALWLMFFMEVTELVNIALCRDCHEPFEPSKSSQKYCDDTCRRRASRRRKQRANGVNTQCIECGKEFKPSTKWHQYCTNVCKQSAYRKRKQGNKDLRD